MLSARVALIKSGLEVTDTVRGVTYEDLYCPTVEARAYWALHNRTYGCSPHDGCSRCSTFGLRLVGSNDERELIVVNTARDRSTDLYWIDFDGQKVHYAEIPPSSQHVQSTFRGHIWIAENSLGYCDSVFIVENNVEIRIK